MNELGEFRIDEIKYINAPIDYIKVFGNIYKINFEQLLKLLICEAIDCNKGQQLEDARLIKLALSRKENAIIYKGYSIIIPDRVNTKIDKILKVLKAIQWDNENIYIKFIGNTEDIIWDQLVKKEIEIKKKLLEEQIYVAENIYGIDICKQGGFVYSAEMDSKFHHVQWMLNDVKQAESFNKPLDEYIIKYKEYNLSSDEEVTKTLDFIKKMQAEKGKGYILEDFLYGRDYLK